MSLEQIGQKLKAARDNSGLSLSQIQERTKIPFNHLESIDSGLFDDLPEPVYVAGFIKRYADCVGLDGQELADQYRQEMDSTLNKPIRKGLFSRADKAREASTPANIHYNRQPIDQGPPNLIKLIPFYALWVVLILGLIIYLVNRQESVDLAQQEPSIATLKQSSNNLTGSNTLNLVSPGKQGAQVSADQVDLGASSPGNQSDTNAGRITLRAKNHVWVEVKAISNGEALFTGFLESGDSRDFYDKEGLHVRAGNGGNVAVVADGATNDLGLPGKIAEKTFTNKSPVAADNSSETANNNESIKSKNNMPSTNVSPTIQKKNEPVAITKKQPLAVTPHKAHTWRADSQGRGYDEPTESNKSLDVPYRY